MEFRAIGEPIFDQYISQIMTFFQIYFWTLLKPHLDNFTMYIIFNLFICVFQVIRLSTFEPSCVGILTREQYRISLLVKRVDYIYVIMTFIGLALFYYAKDLCRNAFFHYTTGVGMGIFLSLVVIIYFIQKRVSSWLTFLLIKFSQNLPCPLNSKFFQWKKYSSFDFLDLSFKMKFITKVKIKLDNQIQKVINYVIIFQSTVDCRAVIYMIFQIVS